MNSDSELAQLKEEVATLRQQMRELRQLITVEYDDTPERNPACVNLRCGAILMCHPSAPSEYRGVICASEDGATLSLSSREGGGNILLTADTAEPCLQLFTQKTHEAIQLTVLPETGGSTTVTVNGSIAVK